MHRPIAQQNESPETTCHALGMLIREGKEVAVGMEWHMAHNLSEEFQKDFLKLRCKALKDVFSDINWGEKTCAAKPIHFYVHDDGVSIQGAEKIVRLHPDRQKPCAVSMSFALEGIDDSRWEAIKIKFRDVFAPALTHGGCKCSEEPDALQISSLFKLAEKGGN
jgi:hypothetical protein